MKGVDKNPFFFYPKSMNKRIKNLLIILIAIFILIFAFLFLNQKLLKQPTFNYIYSGETVFDSDKVEKIFTDRNTIQTFDGHPIFIEPDGECFWGPDRQHIKKSLEQNEHLALVTDNSWCLPNGVAFYVGYFKTAEEAIHFGEYNYQRVTEYLYKITDIPKRDDFTYRIDKICDTDKQGYVVSFEALNAALELISIPQYKCQIGVSYIDTIHNFIENTEYLSYLKVFHIYDVYLGNIPYSKFNLN